MHTQKNLQNLSFRLKPASHKQKWHLRCSVREAWFRNFSFRFSPCNREGADMHLSLGSWSESEVEEATARS